MKKILISLSLLLTLGLTASAALPKEGVYLDKEGSPITEEQMVPPSVKSTPMLPQSAAVHEALSQLPHAASTVLILSIDEDGAVTHEEIAESSSSWSWTSMPLPLLHPGPSVPPAGEIRIFP